MYSYLSLSKEDIDTRIAAVEDILKYKFKNKEYLLRAITHPSAVEGDSAKSYQRLEFLGDSIVSFAVGAEAFKRFSDLNEGDLTRIRISVVNGEFLSTAATELGVEEYIIFGTSEKGSGGRGLNAAAEDVFESLTAALYLDGGIELAYDWVVRNLGEFIDPSLAARSISPKSDLQEKVQAEGKEVSYKIVSSQGPAHAPTFVAEVYVDGEMLGVGAGASKKQAEASAASFALLELERPDKL